MPGNFYDVCATISRHVTSCADFLVALQLGNFVKLLQ